MDVKHTQGGLGTTQAVDNGQKPVGSRLAVSEAPSESESENGSIDPISIGQAARILGLSEKTTRKWCDAGKLGEVVRLERGDRLLDRSAVEQAARERAS